MMSGVPSDRWRGGGRGGYDPSRPRGPRHQGGGLSRDRSGVNHIPADISGGDASQGHDRHMPRSQGSYHQQLMGQGNHHHHHRPPPLAPPHHHYQHHHHHHQQQQHHSWKPGSHGSHFQEHHVPVRNFNAAEARNVLKQAFNNSGSVSLYRTPLTPSTKGNPWGSRANCMANGKDFFMELRKQVFALQQDRPM
ncbi:hypothetical protein AAP_04868 [Ascosphaera apis ARSEF 7405]|uniref:Uncharacterized protein n=1 Tax=Ascosphaera apis ARSEF 7405 TaxID=392613 RepID=A0A167W919_9EURO|nr:hypothetical protein AAP_04868 [Ascosphaera apis ARSEF 7405]